MPQNGGRRAASSWEGAVASWAAAEAEEAALEGHDDDHGEPEEAPASQSSSRSSFSWADETEREAREAGGPSSAAAPSSASAAGSQKAPSGVKVWNDIIVDDDEGGHRIWGGVEHLGSSSSKDTGTSSSSRSQKGGRRIQNRRLDLAEVQMLSNSDSSGISDKSMLLQQQALAAQGHTEQAVEPPQAPPQAQAPPPPQAQAPPPPQAPEREPPGRPQHPETLPSVGSAAHLRGACKPCLFLFEKVGCDSGEGCRFCHFPHTKSSLAKKSKGKRDRFKKLLNRIKAEQDEDEDEEEEEEPQLHTGSGARLPPPAPEARARERRPGPEGGANYLAL